MSNLSSIKNDKYVSLQKGGYTLIEAMIAVSLFLVIVVLGMGSFLNANVLNQKAQATRSVMDSLNFSMEDMSKNLRTGYNYRCVTDGNYSSNLTDPQDCASGGGMIIFEEASGKPSLLTDQWIYKIEQVGGAATNPFNLSKSTDSGATWTQLNPPEVMLDSFSGFSVIGAMAPTGFPSGSGAGDKQQPLITINLSGKIVFKNITTPFALQTTVSQRLLDVYTGS